MKPRRRMTFQLTPLLDLLLIVIFAQFMEVQQQAESAQDDLQQQKQQLVQQFDDGKAELERQRIQIAAAFVQNVHPPQTFGSIFNTRFIVQYVVDVFRKGIDLICEWSISAQHAAMLQPTCEIVKATDNHRQVATIP